MAEKYDPRPGRPAVPHPPQAPVAVDGISEQDLADFQDLLDQPEDVTREVSPQQLLRGRRRAPDPDRADD